MNSPITYVNTDLDLTSARDLTALVAAFESGGMFALHVTHRDDGLWYATLETEEQHTDPEPNVAVIVAVAESLAGHLRSDWDGCTQRELNIGYDCGTHPWGFHQGLSPALLGRIAAVGASLRITLYPEEGRGTPPSDTRPSGASG